MAQILIIDDDHTICAYLRAILEEGGEHTVLEAADGREGIYLFQENPVDLIITDVLMPVKDGVEVIMELKERFPDVKIIAMSGGGRGLDSMFNLRMAKDFGAEGILVKPFSLEDVKGAIQKVLGP